MQPIPTTASIPTSHDLLDLGQAIDRDGVAAHDAALRRLAAMARDAGARSTAFDVLLDPTASDIMRERAFASAARRWAEHRRRIVAHQQPAPAAPFDRTSAPHADFDQLRLAAAHRRWASIA